MPQNYVMLPPDPKVIAHRGFSGRAPENTLAAFDLALKIGADGIEFDIRFSRDLEVMIIHDDKLTRTTDGSGRVCDLESREIQKLDAGSWFGNTFQGQRVPTLRQLLSFLEGWKPLIVLEIKPDSHIPPDYVDRILQPFIDSDRLRDLVILSFDHGLLSPFREKSEPVRCGALVDRKGDPVEQTLQAGAQVLALRRNLVSEAIVKRAHEANLEIIVWTVNREREIRRLLQWQVNGIISNHPDRVLRFRTLNRGDSFSS